MPNQPETKSPSLATCLVLLLLLHPKRGCLLFDTYVSSLRLLEVLKKRSADMSGKVMTTLVELSPEDSNTTEVEIRAEERGEARRIRGEENRVETTLVGARLL